MHFNRAAENLATQKHDDVFVSAKKIHRSSTFKKQKKKVNMAFINEFIPEADIKKYGIEEVNKKYIAGGTNSDQWTIDRDRDVYLRCVARGRDEFRNESTWTLYWERELITIELHLLDAGGRRGESGWAHWKLHHIYIPPHLEARRNDILTDLKNSLTAYKGGGVYARNTEYSVTLDV
ncbi:hypothetical protein [Massilia sp. Root335]|uniref:hypothetical protein n=1 Tax=Massilia sp. Root335 TaxID=1736517 RepID=UPI000AC1D144|nr:hypothetical protein [Massilia sp. Root335]